MPMATVTRLAGCLVCLRRAVGREQIVLPAQVDFEVRLLRLHFY
jgi:hypothetical protein